MKRSNSIKEASRTTRNSLSTKIMRNRSSSNFLQKIPGTGHKFMLSTYSSWGNNQFGANPEPKQKKKNFLTEVMFSAPSGLQSFNNSVQVSKRLKTEPDCPKDRTDGLKDFVMERSIPCKLSQRKPADFSKTERRVNQFEGVSRKRKAAYSVEKLRKIYRDKPKIDFRNSKEMSDPHKLRLDLENSRLPKNIRSTISMPFFSNRTISQINQSKFSNRPYDGSVLDVNKYKIKKFIKNLASEAKSLARKVDPVDKLKEKLFRDKFQIKKVEHKLVLDTGDMCNSREDPSKDELIYMFEDHWGIEKLGFLDKEVIKKREKKEQEKMEKLMRASETKTKGKFSTKTKIRKKLTREKIKELGNKFRVINLSNSKKIQKFKTQRGGFVADEKLRLCRKLLRNLKRLREIRCNDEMIYDFFAKITGEKSALLSCFFDKNKKFNQEMNEYKLIHIFKIGRKKTEKAKKVTYRFPLSKRQYIHKVLAERQRDKSKIKEMESDFKHEQIEEIRLKGNITLELNMIPVMCAAAKKLIEEIQKEMLTSVADEVVIRNNSANKILHNLRFKYSDYFGNEDNILNKQIMIYPRPFFSRQAKDEVNPLRTNSYLDFYQDVPDLQKEDIVKCYRKVERMIAPMVMRHYKAIQGSVVDKFEKRKSSGN